MSIEQIPPKLCGSFPLGHNTSSNSYHVDAHARSSGCIADSTSQNQLESCDPSTTPLTKASKRRLRRKQAAAAVDSDHDNTKSMRECSNPVDDDINFETEGATSPTKAKKSSVVIIEEPLLPAVSPLLQNAVYGDDDLSYLKKDTDTENASGVFGEILTCDTIPAAEFSQGTVSIKHLKQPVQGKKKKLQKIKKMSTAVDHESLKIISGICILY